MRVGTNGNGGTPKEREIDVERLATSKVLRETPDAPQEFEPAEEPPVNDLPSRYALLSHPSAPSSAIRRALAERRQTREVRS